MRAEPHAHEGRHGRWLVGRLVLHALPVARMEAPRLAAPSTPRRHPEATGALRMTPPTPSRRPMAEEMTHVSTAHLTPRWWRRFRMAAHSGWCAFVSLWRWLGENEPPNWYPTVTTHVTSTPTPPEPT
jgi:hypothetical protein